MSQLVLPLSTPPRFTFENLVVHDGIQEAVLTIRSVYGSLQRPAPSLYLYGTHGTGKTHILKALTDLLIREARGLHCTVLTIEPVGLPPSFPDLRRSIAEDPPDGRSLFAAAIDDVHLIQGEDAGHLWNLSNKLTRTGAPLLMGSRTPLEETFTDNPHLQSRIKSGLVFRLEPPEDAIRMVIVDKLARDRNVRVSREVIHYLISRKSRNIKELDGILDALDHASLKLKRRITVPLIKVLEDEGTI
ncbi:MAG: DnaA/Hda family protein [Desulfomonilaceae bacterium]|nr:DnaA/Hda family protein [Desulfomonilaceae bacterium]